MAYIRPTLTQLRAEAAADVNGASDDSSPLLRYANLRISADVQAAMANGQYGYLDYIAKQATPFTATDEYLEGWAAFKGILRKAATFATGTIMLTGIDGAIVTAGAKINRSDGVVYSVAAEIAVAGGIIRIPVIADVAGSGGNAASGTAFTIVSPVPGITSTGVADGPVTGGAEVEKDDSLRSRMLERFAAPAQGGNADDYVSWAKEVAGVTRAWTRPHVMGVGTVTVFFMMDDAQSAFGGFPQGTNGCAADETRDVPATGDQLTVADAMFLQQPVTPVVYAAAPGANVINLAISGISAATSAQKAQISAAITALFLQVGEPGGLFPTILVEAAIAGVMGYAPAVLTSVTSNHGSVAPGSAGNVQSNSGYLATLGGITYP